MWCFMLFSMILDDDDLHAITSLVRSEVRSRIAQLEHNRAADLAVGSGDSGSDDDPSVVSSGGDADGDSSIEDMEVAGVV